MKKVLVAAYAIAAAFMLVACASQEIGRQFDASLVPKIVKGQTTEAQVLQMLGAPYMKTASSNGDVLSYQHIVSEATAFGSAHADLESLVVVFTTEGVVQSVTYTKSN